MLDVVTTEEIFEKAMKESTSLGFSDASAYIVFLHKIFSLFKVCSFLWSFVSSCDIVF